MPTKESLYKSKSYGPIAEVLTAARRPIAPHEFGTVFVYGRDPRKFLGNGRQFVNMTEVSIKRRLCEMVEKGYATSKKREGKAFHEFALLPFDEDFAPGQTDA